MSRKGVPNHQRDEVETVVSRCKRCGSTERSKYFRTTEMEAPNGRGPLGEPATHIVWRACKCESCGQHRIDKFVENRVRVLPTTEVKKVEPNKVEEEFSKSNSDGATSDSDLLDSDILFQ